MRILFIILITLPVSLLAQKEVSTQFVYTGLNYSPNKTSRLLPTFGFYQVDKRQNLNDLQLNQIGYIKRSETNSANLSCSYHKIIGLNKRSDSKFYFGLGLGTNLYYAHTIFKPVNATAFPAANTKMGVELSVKPVINYSFTEKFFLGVSANTGIVDQMIVFSRYENPAIPIEEQKQVQYLAKAFNLRNFNFNVTLGFRIN